MRQLIDELKAINGRKQEILCEMRYLARGHCDDNSWALFKDLYEEIMCNVDKEEKMVDEFWQQLIAERERHLHINPATGKPYTIEEICDIIE